MDLPSKIGLIAGWGRFPIQLAQSLRARGTQVYCVGLAGHVDHSIRQYCDAFVECGLTRMASHVRFFRRHSVQQVTLAGKVHKILLFKKGFLRSHWPDLMTLRTFGSHFITGKKNRNDDALLAAAIDGYSRAGITIQAATDLAPEILVKYGHLAGRRLNQSQLQDVEFGWNLAKEMGRLDVGQTIAVKGRAVLAVEAVEGTDECIRRAGMLCSSGGFTVVKVAKPQQDMRFDVPTVGVGTLQSIYQAGGTVLAIEADRTIVVDESEFVSFAARHKISVISLRDGACELVGDAPASALPVAG